MAVHSGHGCSVMHWLSGPDLHDGAPPSELIYPGAGRFPSCPTPSSRPPSSPFHFECVAVCQTQEWKIIVLVSPPRADAVPPTHGRVFLVQIKRAAVLVTQDWSLSAPSV